MHAYTLPGQPHALHCIHTPVSYLGHTSLDDTSYTPMATSDRCQLPATAIPATALTAMSSLASDLLTLKICVVFLLALQLLLSRLLTFLLYYVSLPATRCVLRQQHRSRSDPQPGSTAAAAPQPQHHSRSDPQPGSVPAGSA